MTSFWYGIFWPYFQFCVFIAFLIYAARKPVTQFLESKRDDFRTKLSEAHEALLLAERKIKQYESQLASLAKDIEAIKIERLHEFEHEKERILSEANKTAESILLDAQRIANEFISQTQKELKKEMSQLVIAEFQKKLSPELFEKLETKFQKDAIDSISNSIS